MARVSSPSDSEGIRTVKEPVAIAPGAATSLLDTRVSTPSDSEGRLPLKLSLMSHSLSKGPVAIAPGTDTSLPALPHRFWILVSVPRAIARGCCHSRERSLSLPVPTRRFR